MTGLPSGEPSIRAIAMPADTNSAGDIFGGWLMSQMDLAAGSVAGRRAGGRCVTASVDGMAFLKPVVVGDEVSLYARILTTGRSSMRIAVEAWRLAYGRHEADKVTEAIFTFVSIGPDRRALPLPPE